MRRRSHGTSTNHRLSRRRVTGAGVALAAVVALSPAAAGATSTATHQRAATVSASVSDTRVVVGKSVTFTGKGSADLTGAQATLQRQVRGGVWMDTSATISVSGNKFTIPVPTSWYGNRTYRAHLVFPDASTVDSATAQVKVVPAYSPDGSASAFQLNKVDYFNGTDSAKVLSRWDPCGPAITYRVNTAKAYRGAVTDVKGAISRLRKATGLRFKYLGTSSKLPKDLGGDQGDADILVMWATVKQVPSLFGAAGLGGATIQGGYVESDGAEIFRRDSGAVWINAKYNSLIPSGFGAGTKYGYAGTQGQLLLHELGHVMGLGHVKDSWQMMKTPMTRHTARYGAGDLAGLNRLGANQGCLSSAPVARVPASSDVVTQP